MIDRLPDADDYSHVAYARRLLEAEEEATKSLTGAQKVKRECSQILKYRLLATFPCWLVGIGMLIYSVPQLGHDTCKDVTVSNKSTNQSNIDLGLWTFICGVTFLICPVMTLVPVHHHRIVAPVYDTFAVGAWRT